MSDDEENRPVPFRKPTYRKTNTLNNRDKGLNMGELLRVQFVQTQKELEESKEKIEDLSKNNSSLKKRARRYKAKIEDLKKEIENLVVSKQLLVDENNDIEDKIRDIKASYHSKEVEWEGKMQENDELKEKVYQQETYLVNNKILRQQIREKDEIIRNTSIVKEELERRLLEVEKIKHSQEFQNIHVLKNKIRTLNEVIESNKIELNKLKTEREKTEISQNISDQTLRKENQRLQNELKNENEVRKKIEKEYEKMNPERMRNSILKIKSSLKDIKGQNFLLSQTSDELEDFSKYFDDQNQILSHEISKSGVDWENKQQGLKKEMNEKIDVNAHERIKELLKENKSLKKEIRDLEAKLKRAKEQKQALSPIFTRNKPSPRKRISSTSASPVKSPVRSIFKVNTLEDEIRQAEKTPLLTEEEELVVHELWKCCNPKCDPMVCCSIEREIVERGGTCGYCTKIFLLILLLPAILIPPLFIYLTSYFSYYYQFDKCCSMKDCCYRFLSHEKILLSGILTSCFYFPGLLYAFVHFNLIVLSHCCCFKKCCYENRKMKSFGEFKTTDYCKDPNMSDDV